MAEFLHDAPRQRMVDVQRELDPPEAIVAALSDRTADGGDTQKECLQLGEIVHGYSAD
jgi:hypothetical protein